MITAVSAWSIWGGALFPGEKDPTGGKHARWSARELTLVDSITRSIKVGRLRTQAVVRGGKNL